MPASAATCLCSCRLRPVAYIHSPCTLTVSGIRNIRRDCIKTLDKQEKDQSLSEDEKAALEKSVQELTDDSVKQIDDAAKAKSNELLKI